MKMEWLPREPPLAPAAVLAVGEAARKLALRASSWAAPLTGVVGDDLLLVMGESLPWVDGVSYFGRDAAAPRLLLPTLLTPSLPVDWLERALVRKFSDATAPFLVWEERVIAAGGARELSPERLHEWGER